MSEKAVQNGNPGGLTDPATCKGFPSSERRSRSLLDRVCSRVRSCTVLGTVRRPPMAQKYQDSSWIESAIGKAVLPLEALFQPPLQPEQACRATPVTQETSPGQSA